MSYVIYIVMKQGVGADGMDYMKFYSTTALCSTNWTIEGSAYIKF